MRVMSFFVSHPSLPSGPDGGTALDLMERFPPNTKFELVIAGRTQCTGRTDAVKCRAKRGRHGSHLSRARRSRIAARFSRKRATDRSFDVQLQRLVTLPDGKDRLEYTFSRTQERNERITRRRTKIIWPAVHVAHPEEKGTAQVAGPLRVLQTGTRSRRIVFSLAAADLK